MTRSQLINTIIKKNNYKTYLEIGVNTPAQPGYNWNSVEIETKHGVDPAEKVNATFKMTSDEFFNKHVKNKYDIVFVDGLHLFEQAYRDIINALKWLNENGTIVVHDCNPLLEKTQTRTHTPGPWHGDVWKAILKLRMEEPNLSIYTVDTDEGCAVIQKGNQKLFTVNDKNTDIYNFSFFDENRKNILNLISINQFKKMMGIESWFTKKINLIANNFLIPKYRRAKKIFSSPTERERRVMDWKKNGSEKLRYEYDLDQNSVVFDFGGYKGQWSAEIFLKYGCKIYIFEPVKKYYENIKDRFSKNNNIKIFPFGLAGNDIKTYIGMDNDGTSTFNKNSTEQELIQLKNASEFIKNNSIEKIDLAKINIEGGEYELLEHLIESGSIKIIKNVQVQFHDFVPNATERMLKIREKLKKTHKTTYQVDFVWENWERKDY